MKTERMQTGFISHRLNKREQEQLWNELSIDVSPIGKQMAQYTPQDKLEYFIISETEISNFKFEAVLKIKDKKYIVKYNDCNQDEKINKLVRKVYGKK